VIAAEVRALLDRLDAEPRRLLLPFGLPGRNELDAASRVGPYAYSTLKRTRQNDVLMFANGCRSKWPPLASRALVATIWREPDRRRDPDNIVSGGRKLILDAIGPGRKGPRGWPGACLIHCDGWHCIHGFVDVIEHAPKRPGIEVVLAEWGQLPLPALRGAILDVRP
jgi:hypothetical protein